MRLWTDCKTDAFVRVMRKSNAYNKFLVPRNDNKQKNRLGLTLNGFFMIRKSNATI